MKRPIFNIGSDAFADWLRATGQPRYRVRQVWRWLLRRGVGEFERMSDLPAALRRQLEAEFVPISARLRSTVACDDGTCKLLIELADGECIECVLMDSGVRRTLCVSTQVGCAIRCTFCASGAAGLVRNLEAHEIVEQFALAQGLLGPERRLTHAVLMGMGEPLANLDAVLAALELVCSSSGLGLSQRRVTISTVGLPERIRRLADLGHSYHLAISLHAAADELRNRLVPVNASIGVRAIVDAADYYFQHTGRQVTYEYALIRDVNDAPEHAHQLGRLLKGRKSYVNLIRYNPVPSVGYQRPSVARANRFIQIVRSYGVAIKLRRTKGQEVEAACGQLRLQRLANLHSADRS
jgi:23S rRNA (adenine2503-C2)-methyltransferase